MWRVTLSMCGIIIQMPQHIAAHPFGLYPFGRANQDALSRVLFFPPSTFVPHSATSSMEKIFFIALEFMDNISFEKMPVKLHISL